MRKCNRLWSIILLLFAAGCGRGPTALSYVKVDADAAARRAISDIDKDGDGRLKGDELLAAPGLAEAMVRADANNDGALTADEIAARITSWTTGPAIAPVSCAVRYQGKLLEGAIVRFVPETFLGETFKTGEGKSNDMGIATVSLPREQRQLEDAPAGMPMGFYRVQISKLENGRETIPDRFNGATTLGAEIAQDAAILTRSSLPLDLR